ncbi:MAG TPA: diguanylate cyclase [Bacillales bacterium]|nr:diguanylate cyclase [Bacillales bacterium]
MGKRKKAAIWLIWLVAWPAGLWWVYEAFGIKIDGHLIDYLLFIVLAVIVAFFPIQVKGTDLVLTHGVLLVIFLEFGLFAEVIAQQIATLAFLAFLRVGRSDHERYPMNLLMFFAISLISGLVYFAAGGEIGKSLMDSFIEFIPVFVYISSIFVSNQILLYGIRRLIGQHRKQNKNFFGKDLLWEAITTLLMIPIAIALYLLYMQLGTAAILFVGIPFVSLSATLRLYHSSEKINNLLQKTNGIGRQLSERLEVKGTLDFFIDKITEIFPVDVAYILDPDTDDPNQLKLLRVFEREKGRLPERTSLKRNDGVSGRVWLTATGVHYFSRKQWYHLSQGFLPAKMQSVMSVPMRRNQEVIGIITLASRKKHAFERHHMMVLEILANFLAVALENARNYEKTKHLSERDPLTDLYNYRYFSDLLESMFDSSKETFPLSIILLDLDHFKKINDTYGHETGNEVLVQLGRRLVNLIGDLGIVARYGGEEFVVVLKNTDMRACSDIAEELRKEICNRPFSCGAQEGQMEQDIQVTASIGIATAPKHGEDPMSLIRNADRAMYTGAKQKGKNRVASYVG